jgi:hypothetical protein
MVISPSQGSLAEHRETRGHTCPWRDWNPLFQFPSGHCFVTFVIFIKRLAPRPVVAP